MASDLIEAMGADLTGRAYIPGQVDTPSEAWSFGELLRRLALMLGGAGRTAAALGVSRSTVYRWLTGRTRTPKFGRRRLVAELRARESLSSRVWAAKRKQTLLHITGWIVKSRDRRRRTLVLRDVPARKITNVINAWLAGDDNRADELLWRAIDQHYAEDMEIDELEEAAFR